MKMTTNRNLEELMMKKMIMALCIFICAFTLVACSGQQTNEPLTLGVNAIITEIDKENKIITTKDSGEEGDLGDDCLIDCSQIPMIYCKSTRYFPTCSHNFPKAGEARFQGRSRLFRLLGKFPYLGESRRILMAVSSKTSSKTRFYYAATRRISSAAVQPSIWA